MAELQYFTYKYSGKAQLPVKLGPENYTQMFVQITEAMKPLTTFLGSLERVNLFLRG